MYISIGAERQSIYIIFTNVENVVFKGRVRIKENPQIFNTAFCF